MIYNLAHLQPFGIELRFKEEARIEDIEPNEMISLLNKYHLLLVRKSNIIDKHHLINFCQTIGNLLEWEFGNVMEMKPDKNAKNYLFTKEKVPFHWDGAFFQSPRYLVFNCIIAPDINAGGETLFANTQSIIKSISDEEKNQWNKIRMRYITDKIAHYGGEIQENLLQQHPFTNEDILRFAEPVMDTALNPVKVDVLDVAANDSDKLIKHISTYCYDANHCYTHTWQNDDLLIADNFALLHARNAFHHESDRHLRRIQIL